MSHSMAKLLDMAALAAPGMFSMMPRARSCRPRWAIGRAVSQSGARIRGAPLGNLEHSLDLHRRIGRKRSDADRGARMSALVAERGDHQVGCAVQHLWSFEKVGGGIDETAEPDHAYHLIEIAERGLDLRQQVDTATARRGVALFHAD